MAVLAHSDKICTDHALTPQNGVWPRLNAVRVLIVIMVAIGYASTMPLGPGHAEMFSHLGYEPSWIGVQLLFFISGMLALRSLNAGRTGWAYLRKRIWGTAPILIASTLAAVIVVYPLCAPDMVWDIATLKALTEYSVLTISGIDPGRPLPGLMDGAPYACLIQGSLWTLRWGLVFHLGLAVLSGVPWLMRVIQNPRWLLTLTSIATLIYISLTYYAVRHDWTDMVTIITPLRLAYAFMMGMSVWAYRDRLPNAARHKALIGLTLLNIALVSATFGPWSPVIEVSLCMAWGYGIWIVLNARSHRLSGLSHWPNLAALIYVLNWPVAQLIVMAAPDISPARLVLIAVPITLIICAGINIALGRPKAAAALG